MIYCIVINVKVFYIKIENCYFKMVITVHNIQNFYYIFYPNKCSLGEHKRHC